jgi:hypothetical protein
MSSFRRFPSRLFGWLIAVACFLCLAVPLAWATLAIYYSNLPWAGMRIRAAAAFAAFAIWALWFSRQRRMFVLAVVLFFGVVAWWISSPRIVPYGEDQAVYLVIDRFRGLGTVAELSTKRWTA